MLDIPGLSVSNWCWQVHTEDRLTRSLILDGYEADVIEAGLIYFIDQWEEAVAWRQNAFDSGALSVKEEYRYYLFCRTELDWAVRQVSVAEQKKFSARIIRADRAFKKTLRQVDKPFCCFSEFIATPEPERHWWLFSVPNYRLIDSAKQQPFAGFSFFRRQGC